MNQFIEVNINKFNKFIFHEYGGFESRNESIIELFNKAFAEISISKIKKRNFFICTDDVSVKIQNEITFGFTNTPGVIIIPDYTFIKWPECGIDSFKAISKKILINGNNLYKYNKLFWIGNPETQLLRFKLIEIGANNYDMMEIIPMQWTKQLFNGTMHQYSHFVSLQDHTEYKYLIDCGARGYSGRLKFLLYSNRPLFLVERETFKQDHFYSELIPYEHFIPVSKDLEDLIPKIEWAENNYKIALEIAQNAREFAINNLNIEKITNFLRQQIIKNLT